MDLEKEDSMGRRGRRNRQVSDDSEVDDGDVELTEKSPSPQSSRSSSPDSPKYELIVKLSAENDALKRQIRSMIEEMKAMRKTIEQQMTNQNRQMEELKELLRSLGRKAHKDKEPKTRDGKRLNNPEGNIVTPESTSQPPTPPPHKT